MPPEQNPDNLTSAPADSTPDDLTAGKEREAHALSLKKKARLLFGVDALIFLVLILVALPIRFEWAKGDLWYDEADYAIAAQSHIKHNRWDTSPDANLPLYQVRLRHYHAPLTVYMAGLGMRGGNKSELALRTPFVFAGAITVGIVYLCGIPLFRGRREIALGCALMTLVTPMHLRASSHAIPGVFITLFLMGLLWTLMAFSVSKKPVWAFGAVFFLAWLFVLTEIIFPTLVAIALVFPFLVAKRKWNTEEKRSLLKALGAGLLFFLTLAAILWPAGLLGGAFRMLFHYTNIHDITYPVNIGMTVYNKAPKWAYLYWYLHDFKPYFLLYVAGALTLIGLIIAKRATRPMGVLALYTLLFLAVSHKAHIIGPEYLVHCLPMLTLLAGLFFYALTLVLKPLGGIAFLPICIYLFQWQTAPVRLGIETKSRASRWPAATEALRPIWKSGDRLLIGTQTPNIPLWYLRFRGKLPVNASQLGSLPAALKPTTRARILGGYYRFIVVSSAFTSTPTLSEEIVSILKTWRVVHQSAEPSGNPQLTIYEFPGVSKPPPASSPSEPQNTDLSTD